MELEGYFTQQLCWLSWLHTVAMALCNGMLAVAMTTNIRQLFTVLLEGRNFTLILKNVHM